MNKKLQALKKTIPNVFSFEIIFVLFLRAGRFKSSEYFRNFPIDLTLFFILLGLTSFTLIVLKKKQSISKNGFLFIFSFFLFILFAAFSLSWTPSSIYAEQKIIKLSTLCLFCIISGGWIIGMDLSRIRRFLVCLACVDSLIAIRVLLASVNHVPGTFLNVLVPEGGKGAYLGLSAVLSCLLLVVLIYTFFKKNHDSIPKTIYFIPILIYLLLEIGARGPVLSLMFSFVLIIVWFKFKPALLKTSIQRSSLNVSIALFMLGVFCIVTYFASPIVQDHVNSSTTLKRVQVALNQEQGGSSIEQRIIYYKSAIDMFLSKPVFGWGIGAFTIFGKGNDVTSYPHNIILEIISEFGFFGLVLFFPILLMPFRLIFLHKKQAELEYVILFGLFLYYFSWSLMSGSLTSTRELYVISAILSVMRDSICHQPSYLRLPYDSRSRMAETNKV